MRHASLTAALTLALVLALGATALAAFAPASVTGDFDGDGDADVARTVDPDGTGQRTQVNVQDECSDGSTLNRRISGIEDSLAFLKLYRADTRPGREVFTDVRSGASGRVGEARLTALRPTVSAGPCPLVRTLFRYSSQHPSRPPHGATESAGYVVKVKDLTAAFDGREVLLDEFYVTKALPAACCPSFRKRRLYRFDAGADRYLRYSTKVTRLHPQS